MEPRARTNGLEDLSVPFALRDPHRIRSTQSWALRCPHFTVIALEIQPLPGKAWHDLSSDHSTLSIVLGQTGGKAEPRLQLHRPIDAPVGYRYANYVPPGTRVWGFTENLGHLRDLRVSFDAGAIAETLGDELDAAKADAPVLLLSDERVFAMGELLFAECLAPDALSPLYTESLVTALLTDVLRIRKNPEPASARGALAPWQLRRVTEFIEAHLADPIGLTSLAALLGLSPSRFGRGFKASTGMSPHQWLLNARIRRAQELLLKGDLALADVALASGFSEQSHFNRTFRRLAGSTPGQWRRDRRGRVG